MSAMDFFHQIRLGSYQLALPVPGILKLCNYLQNVVAITYIFALQLSTFLFYNKQGSHFTSPKFTQIFLDAGAKISMDHRGRAYDNIFVERLWRTVKYEDVYPNAYETPREARIGINNFMNFYNHERPHSRLKYRTPEEVYWDR